MSTDPIAQRTTEQGVRYISRRVPERISIYSMIRIKLPYTRLFLAIFLVFCEQIFIGCDDFWLVFSVFSFISSVWCV